eukprot:7254715-Alexandrium_andersonii.AAC.1
MDSFRWLRSPWMGMSGLSGGGGLGKAVSTLPFALSPCFAQGAAGCCLPSRNGPPAFAGRGPVCFAALAGNS